MLPALPALICPNVELSNQIARHFDDQYLWKQSINILNFLQKDKERSKETFETNTFNCAWSGIPIQAQTCRVLSEVFLNHLRSRARLNISQNERLITLKGSRKVFFPIPSYTQISRNFLEKCPWIIKIIIKFHLFYIQKPILYYQNSQDQSDYRYLWLIISPEGNNEYIHFLLIAIVVRHTKNLGIPSFIQNFWDFP